MLFFKQSVVALLTVWVAVVRTKSIEDFITEDGSSFDYGDYEEDDDLDSRVIGGRDAEEGEFPYMMSLHYRNRFICSGFLVTPSVAITAAHCVKIFGDEAEDPRNYTGYVGTLQRDGPEQKVELAEFVVPDEYGNSTEWDLALIKLSKPVELNDNCQTICLPTSESNYENRTAQVVGWGVTERWGFEPAKILQTATENIPTYENCEYVYSVLDIPVTRRHICAGGERDKGVCFGDSGGPLVPVNQGKPIAIGIASFVSWRGCAQKFIPAVYTSTASYLDWITENMGEKEASKLCIREQDSVLLI